MLNAAALSRFGIIISAFDCGPNRGCERGRIQAFRLISFCQLRSPVAKVGRVVRIVDSWHGFGKTFCQCFTNFLPVESFGSGSGLEEVAEQERTLFHVTQRCILRPVWLDSYRLKIFCRLFD